MTLDERKQLQAFLFDLIQARASEKDKVAEALILEACTRQPDALYLLVQRVMGAEQMLKRLLAPNPEQQPNPPPTSLKPVQQFLNPSVIASTTLGVMAGSLLEQGSERYLESDNPEGLTNLDLDEI